MKTKDQTLKNIFREVAEEFNLPSSMVEHVFNSAYKTLADTIARGDKGDPSTFKFVKIPFLGRFVIKMNRVGYFKNFKGFDEMYPFYKNKAEQIKKKKDGHTTDK